jgi:hypothetical protein
MSASCSERLAWAGPGAIGFLRRLASSEVRSSEEDRSEAAPSQAVDDMVDDMVDDVVTEEPGLIDASNVASWIGEDGGPGERDGLCAFLDDEAIGSVVLPMVRSDALTPVLRFALENPQLFLFVPSAETRDQGEPALLRPLPNVAQLRVPRGSDYGAADLARYIESRDFVPRVARSVDLVPKSGVLSKSEDHSSVDPETWITVEEEIVSILAWRRWRGLERSLDRGTRWVVFESAMPALIRSIDRAVRGFLRQLTLDGFFPTLGGWDVSVSYETERREENEGRLVLRVQAGLAGVYGVALSLDVPSTSLVSTAG